MFFSFCCSTKYLKSLAKTNTSPFYLDTTNENSIYRFIYDLLNDGIRGTTRKDAILAIIGDLAGMHTDLPSLILDTIGIFDAETANSLNDNSHPSEERIAFCEIARDAEKILSEKLLKERLEIDTLNEVGLIKNNNFYTKFIKVKTKL